MEMAWEYSRRPNSRCSASMISGPNSPDASGREVTGRVAGGRSWKAGSQGGSFVLQTTISPRMVSLLRPSETRFRTAP
jgi:hypothetical protein